MSSVRTIAKNTGILFTSSLVSKAFSFFFTMYSAQYLGDEGFGLLSFMLALAGMLGILTDIGLAQLLTREVSRDRALTGKYLYNTLIIKVILVAVTLAAIGVAMAAIGETRQVSTLVYLFCLYVILMHFYGVFTSLFQAYERMEFQSIGDILNSAILLAGTMVIVAQGTAISLETRVTWFAMLYVVSAAAAFIYSAIIFVRVFGFPKPELDLKFWRPTVAEALPFGITGSFVLIYTYVDSIILEFMKGSAVVGWYNAAYRLVLVLGLVPTVVNVAIFPSMSRMFISSKDQLRLIYEKYFKYMVMLSIPLGVGTTMVADKIIYLIYKAEFGMAIVALQILIWTAVVSFIGASFIKLFESMNMQRVITRLTGACVLVNVILNLIFIPQYSYVAAGVITVLTECVLVCGLVWYARRLGYGIESRKIISYFSKTIAATLVMGGFLYYFRYMNLLVLVVGSILIYFAVYVLIGGLDREDMQLIRGILGKKSGE